MATERCESVAAALEALRGRALDRRLRLFASAVYRLLPPLPDQAEQRERQTAVAVAERYADGQAGPDELKRAAVYSRGEGFWSVAHRDAFEAAHYAVRDEELAGCEDELKALLDCVFGPPVFIPPRCQMWSDGVVVKLAETIYDGRRWDELPMLADALEEAGMEDPAALEHLRGPGPHCPGCHVLDAVLGRT